MSAQTFVLPDLGEGLTEAEVVRWLVAVGEEVTIDAPVVEVETAKSLVEIPSPFAGIVSTLHADEGTTIDVGRPLITIDSVDRAGSGNVLIGYGTPDTVDGVRRRHRRRAPLPHEAAAPAVDVAVAPRVISPIVRRLARENGLDLALIGGTGLAGLITRHDVETKIAGARPAGGAPDRRTGLAVARRAPMSAMRKSAAVTLSRSRSEIPEATVWVDVDATALVELRASMRRGDDPGPGLLAILARFVVAGLTTYPALNGQLDAATGEILEFDGINLGLAVQGVRGLVAPAVLNAHTMTTRMLDAEIRSLTTRAREGRATPFELSAGTFTLNNYGSLGVDGSAAIINHPQVAMLGIGRIIDRPWVRGGSVAVRKMAQISFVFDHRVCDGGVAAGFMRFVADAIEDPASLLADL